MRANLCGNGNLNLDTGLDVDDDLLDDLSWCVQVDETLVDSAILVSISFLPSSAVYGIFSPHLEHVPSLGTLTARSLTGGDLEVLGWHADWALDAQLLALSTLDELAADLLEGLDLAAGEGDADLVDLWGIEGASLLCVLERHVGGF